MAATDRLAELRRQRARIAEHLAWLDCEISAEENAAGGRAAGASRSPVAPIGGPEATRAVGGNAVPVPATPAAADVPISPAPPESAASPAPAGAGAAGTSAATAAAEADALLDEYRVPAGDLKKDVRNGCLFYFVAALVALAAIVAVLYYVARR